jgi:hypothetical protein
MCALKTGCDGFYVAPTGECHFASVAGLGRAPPDSEAATRDVLMDKTSLGLAGQFVVKEWESCVSGSRAYTWI